MTEKFFLLHRSHRVTVEDFFKQSLRMSERPSLEEAQKSMHSLTGSCIILKGEIIDSNCIEDEE